MTTLQLLIVLAFHTCLVTLGFSLHSRLGSGSANTVWYLSVWWLLFTIDISAFYTRILRQPSYIINLLRSKKRSNQMLAQTLLWFFVFRDNVVPPAWRTKDEQVEITKVWTRWLLLYGENLKWSTLKLRFLSQ